MRSVRGVCLILAALSGWVWRPAIWSVRSGEIGPQVGYAILSAESGSIPIVSALFSFHNSDGVLVSEAAVAAQPLRRSGRILVDQQGQRTSEAGVAAVPATRRARIFIDAVGTQVGLAAANSGTEESNLTLRLLNRNGSVREQRQRVLPPGGQTAFFAGEVFPSFPAGFTGLLEVEATVPIRPLTLKLTRNGRGDFILTTLPLADLEQSPGAAPTIVPHLGFGPLPGLGRFSTRLIVINRDSDQPTSGELVFIESDGSPLELPGGSGSNRQVFRLGPGGGVQLRPGSGAAAVEILFPGAAGELSLNRGNSYSFAGSGMPGSHDGMGTEAAFNHPQGVVLDARGRLWVADRDNHTIRRIDLSTSVVTTVAGLADTPGSQDGRGGEARFDRPAGMALEPEPLAVRQARELRGEPPPPVRVLVADSGNRAIRRVFEDGRVETLFPPPAPRDRVTGGEPLLDDSRGSGGGFVRSRRLVCGAIQS